MVWFSRSYRLLFWFGRRVLPLQKYIITIPFLYCLFIILLISWNVNLCRIWRALVCWWPTVVTWARRVLKRTGSWMYTRLILSRNECQCFSQSKLFIWWTDRSSLHFVCAKFCTDCSAWAGVQDQTLLGSVYNVIIYKICLIVNIKRKLCLALKAALHIFMYEKTHWYSSVFQQLFEFFN